MEWFTQTILFQHFLMALASAHAEHAGPLGRLRACTSQACLRRVRHIAAPCLAVFVCQTWGPLLDKPPCTSCKTQWSKRHKASGDAQHAFIVSIIKADGGSLAPPALITASVWLSPSGLGSAAVHLDASYWICHCLPPVAFCNCNVPRPQASEMKVEDLDAPVTSSS